MPAQPPASTNASASQPPVTPERDELSEWFAKASDEPSEPFAIELEPSGQELDWKLKNDASPASTGEVKAPAEEEDLSWLHNLEAEAKKTGELSKPRQEDHWSSVLGPSGSPASSSQDDLSWLDSPGSLPAAEQPPQEIPSSQEDLGWLNSFGGTPQAPQPPVAPSSGDDLSWLDQLGTLPSSAQTPRESSQPMENPSWLDAFTEPQAAPQNKEAAPPAVDDLSWLDELGKSPASTPPAPLQPQGTGSDDDLSWLREPAGNAGTRFQGPWRIRPSNRGALGKPGRRTTFRMFPHSRPATLRRSITKPNRKFQIG